MGMGGSAAGGDILAGWLAGRPGVELTVWKGGPPARSLRETLAIACSASGDTVETVGMVKTAVRDDATTVCISAGGKLKELSQKLGVPHVMMPNVLAPRYMLPFVVFSCLSVLNQGLGLDCDREAQEALDAMAEEGNQIGYRSPTGSNPSKELALKLVARTPAIYGTAVTRGVGIRFKNVINENAKRHSYFDGVPDTFHNEIEAWEDSASDVLPVFLRHSADNPRDGLRIERMMHLLRGSGTAPIQVKGRGKSSLGQLMSMAYMLDLASYYLALSLGRDPFPTVLIDRLKKR